MANLTSVNINGALIRKEGTGSASTVAFQMLRLMEHPQLNLPTKFIMVNINSHMIHTLLVDL